MNAAVLAVGTELLGSDRTDTNSLWLADVFRESGWNLVAKAVIGDDEEQIADQIRQLARLAEVVVVTGGLGPTSDDRTREALELLTGEPLELDEAVLAAIVERARQFARVMPEANRRQALVPRGAKVLPNSLGTAPGLEVNWNEKTVFVLPGVPSEMHALVESFVKNWLLEHSHRETMVETVELRTACLPESAVEDRLDPLTRELGSARLTLLASIGQVIVRIRDDDDDPKPLAEHVARAHELLGDAVFTDRGQSLEAVVGDLLEERGETLVTAESCTGGLLGSRLTSTPGSSAYYLGGVVSYSNELKSQLLGVAPEMIETHGAVSGPVARAMANGARERLGSSYAVSITGVAGPGGGSQEKPVGTVHFALATQDGDILLHRVFPTGRERVRRLAAQSALEMVRRRLLNLESLGEGVPYYAPSPTEALDTRGEPS